MKILLTGFEPFLGMSTNPTEQIVNALSGTEIDGKIIDGKVLPVDFNKTVLALLAEIEAVQPDVVLSLGLALGRTCITPERIAINCMDGEKDNAGQAYQDEKISFDGPDGYFSTLPNRELVTALLADGLPAKVSNTAGTYLCNQTMYAVRHYTETNGLPLRSGFVHIPADHQLALAKPTIASWSLDDLTRAITVIIQAL